MPGEGRIVEGHGDLRPEHVCLQPDIAIIDGLEFSASLRIVDPLDELGFLALECERLGSPHAAELLLRIHGDTTGDKPDRGLVHFYQAFRAVLRASIAIRHLDERKFRHCAEWQRHADSYLQHAEKHQDAINSVIDPQL